MLTMPSLADRDEDLGVVDDAVRHRVGAGRIGRERARDRRELRGEHEPAGGGDALEQAAAADVGDREFAVGAELGHVTPPWRRRERPRGCADSSRSGRDCRPWRSVISASVGAGLRRQQGRGLHDLAGLAVAALRHADVAPGDLHGMLALGVQALDRGHRLAGDVRHLRRCRSAPPRRRDARCRRRTAPTPQPNLVPVRPSSSRRYHRSGIDGSPSIGALLIHSHAGWAWFPPRHSCFSSGPHAGRRVAPPGTADA